MRIVSLAPSNTEILYALGCGDMIVACTRYCDYPPDATKKPKVGGWLDVNDELVLEYKPDIVMTSTFVQDKIVARYQEKGITLFHTDPKTLSQVYESILAIGKLVGKEGKGLQLVDSMKNDFEKIQKNNEEPNERKSIGKEINKRHHDHRNGKIKAYCEEWHKPPTVSGNWVPQVIGIAGGISLCHEGKISYPVSLEDVASFDPDCIVISICGMGANASPDLISKREGWQDLRAVKEGRIFVIDDSLLNRPGPRLVDGARELSLFFRRLG